MLRQFLRQSLGNQRRFTYVQMCRRFLSDTKAQDLTEGEQKLLEALKKKFPGHTEVQVADISGGCGAMFEVSIEAEEFRGLKTVKQHMLVNQALKEEIQQMHGMRINTKAPG
ncbi:bolA-like protein 3 [Mya arenaria]|nr:bolA-like protein 3 [Mya arenaria]XP_052817366.1 bolA-like protein 3 [Mya arenaria]